MPRISVKPTVPDPAALRTVRIRRSDASGSVPEPTVTGHYRGTAIENHLRPKTRMECVTGDDHVATVVDTVLKLGGDRRFVFVVGVEQVFPTDTVMDDEAVAATTG